MSPAVIFNIQLVLGYVPWLFFFGAYWPRLKAMDGVEAQRAIAMLHAFRFFGLVFLVPGLIGPKVPADFAVFAAYGDFATGALAMLALFTIRVRFFFWPLVLAYNVVGLVDLIGDYYHGNTLNIGAWTGDLGFTYAIPIIYVPILMITHFAAFYLLMRRGPHASSAQQAVAS